MLRAKQDGIWRQKDLIIYAKLIHLCGHEWLILAAKLILLWEMLTIFIQHTDSIIFTASS